MTIFHILTGITILVVTVWATTKILDYIFITAYSLDSEEEEEDLNCPDDEHV